MRFLRSILAIVALLLVGVWSEAHAGTIYDNTTTPQGGFGFTALQQHGGEVHAAGTDRLVTDLFIGMYRKGVAGTNDMQARLYANDGLGGKPGTLLWESPLLQSVHLTGGIDLIDFSVPMVLVPDTFTWTVQISNISVAVGLPAFDPPTVGSSPTNWEGNGTMWGQVPGSPYEARVEAVAEVPEPSSALLLLAGSGLVLCGRVWSGRRGRFSFARAAGS
jgi:PEP-CTERM motif